MILVTGATGFVGKALCASLVRSRPVRVAVRNSAVQGLPDGVDVTQKLLLNDQDWSDALVGVNVVVHCAARVHVMKEDAADPLAEFRRVNVDGTLRLASQAAGAGVKRFVFISSIKVNGEQTRVGEPFTADQQANPGDPYGVSKMEAENGLRKLAQETGLEVVIIRPPLVYGPRVKANFLAMMRWLRRGLPLPLGAVTENRRSLVGLDNLIDLIVICLDHPVAANQTFLVSDGEDLSTTALLWRMGEALGKPARLFPVPVWMLEAGAALLGKRDLSKRLCGNLQVDISKARDLLGWSPPVSVDEGLSVTAEHFLAGLSK
jgi:nucleoside-diphosphate-sugar epimerase